MVKEDTREKSHCTPHCICVCRMTSRGRKKNIHQVPLKYLQVTQEWLALLVISFFSRDWWAQNSPFTD